jgi:hypothetical protein
MKSGVLPPLIGGAQRKATPAPTPSAPLARVLPDDNGSVRVVLDKIVRPGALVSGIVTLTDGVTAKWYLDQTGRFGLIPPTPGYQPLQKDLERFQTILEEELARQGF